jgi:hypothetical protein
MTTYSYVDNSNLYIEGCRVSAVKKGMAKSIYDAMDQMIVDHTWNLDYGKLYGEIVGLTTSRRQFLEYAAQGGVQPNSLRKERCK